MKNLKASPRELTKGLSSADLAKRIFKGELKPSELRDLPPQTLYMALQQYGWESALEVLPFVSEEQYKAFLDFELWNKDTFSEERFFQWLVLIDEANSLERLMQFLKCIDRSLLALMISRYVEATILDDPTDMPPTTRSYTPDNGSTWLAFLTDDPEKTRLLGKMLALIFQSNAELFYQLLSAPLAATGIEYEEESFQDKGRRLSILGFPTQEFAAELQSPLTPEKIRQLLQQHAPRESVTGVPVVDPIVYQPMALEPLSTLAREISASSAKNLELFEGEMSLVTNAAIVFFGVEVCSREGVEEIISQIRGAINIGLQRAMALEGNSAVEVFNILGLQKLYRLGIGGLRRVRSKAQAIAAEQLRNSQPGELELVLVGGAREDFPVYPKALELSGNFQVRRGEVKAEYKPFETLAEIHLVEKILVERFGS